MSNISTNARRILINVGRCLPFALCFVVLISYVESMYSLFMQSYVYYKDFITLNTQITFAIGGLFEYDILVVAIIFIVTIAIESCIWNRLAVLYLALHLLFKRYIETIELEEYQIYLLCLINILINVILIYKGLKQWLTFK